jgi:hypothetical protein
MPHDGVIRVARHVQHLEIRKTCAQSVGQLSTAQLRHYHIRQQHADTLQLFVRNCGRFQRITHGNHIVTAVREYVSGESAHSAVVLHQQNAFPASYERYVLRRGSVGRQTLRHMREHQAES